MNKRGRPALTMTKRRQQILREYENLAFHRQPVSYAELARRCGLFDYREARRIVNDLRKMHVLPSIYSTVMPGAEMP